MNERCKTQFLPLIFAAILIGCAKDGKDNSTAEAENTTQTEAYVEQEFDDEELAADFGDRKRPHNPDGNRRRDDKGDRRGVDQSKRPLPSKQPQVKSPRQQSSKRQTTPPVKTVGERGQTRDQLKEHLKQKKPESKDNRLSREQQNKQRADRVRKKFKEHRPHSKEWFNDSFYAKRRHHPPFYKTNVNLWRGASWAGVSGWLTWGGASPVYYEADGSTVYLPVDNADYSQQGSQNPDWTSSNGQNTVPNIQGDWLPLGVFAIGRDENAAAESNVLMQLALKKNGEIFGTYYSTNSDVTYEIEGMVDRESQRAVWKVSDKPEAPIISTGIYNLTQDATEVTVHYNDGLEQTWMLVRLEE